MDVFNMDLEEQFALPPHDLYSSSLESNTSLPDLEEAQTPLLYDSKITALHTSSSRHNSLVPSIEEHLIDTLDLSESMTWSSSATPEPITLKCNSYSNFNLIESQMESTTVIEATIEKGTTTLKNNYKLWLTSQ